MSIVSSLVWADAQMARNGLGLCYCDSIRNFVVSFWFEQIVFVRIMRFKLPFGGGFGYRGWLCVAIVIFAAVIGWLASTSTVQAFGLLEQIHELPMLGFLSWAEQFIIGGIVPLGFNVGAGIDLFLIRQLA